MSSTNQDIFKDATVVIPAAGGSRDVLGRNSDFPAALIRLGSKPIVYLTIEYLIQQGFKNFRVGVPSHFLSKFQDALHTLQTDARIEFFEGVKGESSIGTIGRLLSDLPGTCPVLINLGDTLCKWDQLLMKDTRFAILIEKIAETERWSTASLNEYEQVTRVFDKGNSKNGVFGICGVYWWRFGSDLFSVFPEKIVGTEISDILNPFVGKDMRGIFPEVWCDSDHGDMRENSRHRILESRSFNTIEIDDFRGTIRKSSTNPKKLVMEIEYYKKLPSELKIYFPRMLDYNDKAEKAFQILEYYAYPTLSEIYCYEDAPKFVWKRILEKLSQITFDEFSSIAQPNFEPEPTLREVFILKTIERNTQIARRDDVLSVLLNAPNVIINGKSYKGAYEVLELSGSVIDALPNVSSVIHGDFCLSNILCEPDSNNIKLIDPRGGFAEASCFGPQLYDIAKLGHSLVGRYDLIIADKFLIDLDNIKECSVYLEIFQTSKHDEIELEFFNSYLNGQVSSAHAKLLSGLILLSIPIFHLEKLNRACALMIQGIKLTNAGLEELL